MLFKMFRKTLCCIKMVERISITLLSLSETCPTIHKTGCQKKRIKGFVCQFYKIWSSGFTLIMDKKTLMLLETWNLNSKIKCEGTRKHNGLLMHRQTDKITCKGCFVIDLWLDMMLLSLPVLWVHRVCPTQTYDYGWHSQWKKIRHHHCFAQLHYEKCIKILLY